MTAPINTPSTGAAKDAASARKRRRRAPAGGAADDCFTCAKRNVKCDRRRPYCSQCLEIGNECSGYKTQLTWGVGVASRGKLRGLSLPIAKAPPVNQGKTSLSSIKSPTTTARARTTSVTSTGQWPPEQDERVVRGDMEMGHGRSPSVTVPPFHHPYDMSHMSPTESAPPGWTHIPFSSSMPPTDGPRFPPPRGLHINVSTPGDMMMHREMIHTPLETMSEVDYMSPIAHSFPRDDVPQYIHSPIVYEGFPTHGPPVPQSPPGSIMIEQPRAPASCPSLVYGPSEPTSSLQSHMSHVETLEAQLSRKLPHEYDVLVPGTPDLDTYSSSAQSHHGPFWASSNADEESVSRSVNERGQAPWANSYPSQSPSPALQMNPDLATKMPFFIDYYEKSMCPSMVFIDGPNNPFREHILALANNSRSLQHAICALAACNLRMKRKLSLGYHSFDISEKRIDGSPVESPSDGQGDQALTEEYQHRNLAVRLLDEQLNDAEKSTQDSVLATILLLCHYRMAESGVAKFHTQFAGVKKILGMRRMSPYPPSRDSAWMEALFTYFDAISASVNDREAQLNTSFYGVLPDAQLLPPGAENLVGCDRELFRSIIKLGRLNLLSQQRPVQNLLASSPLPRVNENSRSASPLGAPFKSSPLLAGPDHHHSLFGGLPHPINSSVRFDGNGFGSTLDDNDHLGATSMHSPSAYDDHRSAFWREWKEARIALQTWEFDANRVRASLTGPPLPLPSLSSSPTSPGVGMGVGTGINGTTPPPTATQIRDLNSLSEAFRYAALLYTERLASPHSPSTHNNFRNLVSQVVYYATSLEAGSSAEKFLLWPLFVAGSECVNELQQNIVRSKCREIMNRSGYMNNLAALEVLERLWAGEVKDEYNRMSISGLSGGGGRPGTAGQQQRGGPFNWIKCIGGSQEVEWIMF